MSEKLKKIKLMWKTPPQGRFLTIKEMLSYAIAGIGVSFIVNVICVFLTAEMIPYMYQIDVIHGRNIFTICAIVNIIAQPILGNILDNTKTKWGKFKPYILFLAPIISVLVMLSTFIPQNMEESHRVIYAYATCIPTLIIYVFWYNAYNMIPAVMTPVSQERTDMLSPVGLVLGFAPTLINLVTGPVRSAFIKIGKEYWAFRIIGLVSCVIGIVFVLQILKIKERVYQAKEQKEKISFFEGLKLVLKNKPFIIFIAATIIGSLRIVMDLNMGYVAQFRFDSDPGTALTIQSFASLIWGFAATPAMLLLPFLTRKFNNKTILIIWQGVACIVYGLLGIIGFQNIKIGITSVIVITISRFLIGFNANGTLTPIIMSELFDYQQYKTGQRIEGFMQSLFTIATGSISSFLLYIPTVIQKKLGFQPANYQGKGYVPSVEDMEVMTTWFNVAAIISCISGVLFIALMMFYNLNKEKYEKAIDSLKNNAVSYSNVEE